MSDHHPASPHAQQLEKPAISSARLEANLEAIGEPFENAHQLVDLTHLIPPVDFPVLIENTNRNVLGVNVQPHVKHTCLPRLGNCERV